MKPASGGLIACGMAMIFLAAVFVFTGKVESRGGLVTDSPLGVWSFALGFGLGGLSMICLAISGTTKRLSSGIVALSNAGMAVWSLGMGLFSILRGMNARLLLPETNPDSNEWFRAVGLIACGLLLLALSGRFTFLVIGRKGL